VILSKRALKVAAASGEEREAWLRALRETVRTAVKLATVSFGGEEWIVDPKYALFKKVGSGAYGCVAAARDTSDEARAVNGGEAVAVAIKKIANVFADAVDAKRILREVRLMRNWGHPCVLGLYDVVEPSFSNDFEDLYLVTPLLTTDLAKIIYSKTVLSEEQKLYLFYQMCCGVHYINSAGVLHRDLKPANLLVDVKTCTLKVCDFGLSRCARSPAASALDDVEAGGAGDGARGGADADYTEYVVTRWYRAPEIMLGLHRYGAPIDCWSLACIFAEVLLKEPLFAGNDYLHQLKIILRQIGSPSAEDAAFVDNAQARAFLDGQPAYDRKPLAQRITNAPRGTLALVEAMLQFHPTKRRPIADCVADACFDEYREEDLEARAGFSVEMDDVESVKLEKGAIQKLLYDDIRAFHRSEPADRAPPPRPQLDKEDSIRTAISLDRLNDIRDAMIEDMRIN